ncbi:MAG: zinc ribbon domain-containing protein [Anaerolineaceae bacterium]|nr:zinc ribbon domain-containing protein [Anaerolineaceae bacterium]
MDQQEAKHILGFDLDSMPSPEEIKKAYSIAKGRLAKAELAGENLEDMASEIDLAYEILMPPDNFADELNSTALQLKESGFQSGQQPQNPVINMPSFGSLGSPIINYLTCPRCNAQVSEGYQICPNCHNQVARNCPSCGQWVSVEATNCSRCGLPIAVVAANRFNKAELEIQKRSDDQIARAEQNAVNESKNYSFMAKSIVFWIFLGLIILGLCILGFMFLNN